MRFLRQNDDKRAKSLHWESVALARLTEPNTRKFRTTPWQSSSGISPSITVELDNAVGRQSMSAPSIRDGSHVKRWCGVSLKVYKREFIWAMPTSRKDVSRGHVGRWLYSVTRGPIIKWDQRIKLHICRPCVINILALYWGMHHHDLNLTNVEYRPL